MTQKAAVAEAVLLELLDDDDEDDDLVIYTLLLETRITKVHCFNINLFTITESRSQFRFSAAEISRLIDVFGLPSTITTKEGLVCTAIEGLCVLLKRLAYPVRYGDMTNMFGRSPAAICCIFYHVLGYLYYKYKDLLYLNVNWIGQRMEDYAIAIHKKGCPMTNVWAFIDGTVRVTCRPTNGQRSLYSGHKRKHGIKFQTLVTPDGLISHLWGPIEARRHDITMLRASRLDEALGAHQCFNNYFVYGDPAYGCTERFVCPFDTVTMTQEQRGFNRKMSKVRVSVEWLYGDVTRYWATLDMKQQNRIQQTPVAQMYTVSVLLTNCITTVRGSNTTSTYFGLNPPTLAQYFGTVPIGTV
jgi:nuclease HARBI1